MYTILVDSFFNKLNDCDLVGSYQHSILSDMPRVTAGDWILSKSQFFTLNDKGRWARVTVQALAWLCFEEKEWGSEPNSHNSFLKNKLFELQIYIMLNTGFDYEIFYLMMYCIFFRI